MWYILILDISDHSRKCMIGSMRAALEALDAPSRTVTTEKVLAWITLFPAGVGRRLHSIGRKIS
jgi:hypothetical protein